MRHEEATSRINTCYVHQKYSPYSLDSSLIKPVKSDHSAFYNRVLLSVEMEIPFFSRSHFILSIRDIMIRAIDTNEDDHSSIARVENPQSHSGPPIPKRSLPPLHGLRSSSHNHTVVGDRSAKRNSF